MKQIAKAYKVIWKVLKGKEKFFFVGIFFLCLTRAFSYLGFAQVLSCLTAKALSNTATFFWYSTAKFFKFSKCCGNKLFSNGLIFNFKHFFKKFDATFCRFCKDKIQRIRFERNIEIAKKHGFKTYKW